MDRTFEIKIGVWWVNTPGHTLKVVSMYCTGNNLDVCIHERYSNREFKYMARFNLVEVVLSEGWLFLKGESRALLFESHRTTSNFPVVDYKDALTNG